MIKIKLLEIEKHRNETTFRPFLMSYDLFKDVGIEFITTGETYDYAWVGQASIIDKKVSLTESIDKGLEFINKITDDYFIIDGQDSTSLIGTIDVFRESKARLFLKNSYLNDFDLYKQKSPNGRIYWKGDENYSVDDIDDLKSKMKLTGCNWLNTININIFNYDAINKEYDISCMFGYPTRTKVYEHGLCQTDYYDKHRKELLYMLHDSKYKIAKLTDGQRIPEQEYNNKMFKSKIIMAPLGYGELAPRDIQSAMIGSILVKPDISFVNTKPNILTKETYVPVKYDWSDLELTLGNILNNYDQNREYYVENMRQKIKEELDPTKLVLHIYDIFKNLDSVE